MNILNAVIRMLDNYPFQLAVCANMFVSAYPKRRGFWARIAVWFIPMIVVYDIGTQSFPSGVSEFYLLDRATLLLPLIYIGAGLVFCYHISVPEALLCTSGAHPTQNILFNLYWIAKLKFSFEERTAQSLLFSFLIMLAVYTAVYFVLTSHLSSLNVERLSKGRILGNALLVIVLVIFFNRRITGFPEEQWVYISYIMADVLALVIQFDLFHESELESRYAIVEQLLYSERKKQQMTAENVEIINRKCHDLKHQIAGLRRMSSGKERDEYIDRIESAVMFYERAVKTGNETLDLILMEKLLYCQEHKIKFTVISDGEKLKYLDAMDIYALFGNAIDNAIESVSHEAEETKRIISMRVGTHGQFLSIHIENYVSEDVKLDSGLPVTTKSDKQYHGFGMLSIKRIAEKYDGTMSIRGDRNLFQLDILIPIETKSAS